MLIRIVRMTFLPEQIGVFLTIFNGSSAKIRSFPGCHHLELWQDAEHPNIYCTYSHWIDDNALQNYRQSDLFRQTWAETKKLFAEKPVAFSVIQNQVIEAAKRS